MPDSYYERLAREYGERRDLLRGAYYIMCDISAFGYKDDVSFALHLLEEIGVAAVPGSSFFDPPERGSGLIRFCFCKRRETPEEAGHRLARLQ
jgi:aminotransferase